MKWMSVTYDVSYKYIFDFKKNFVIYFHCDSEKQQMCVE